MLILTLRTDKPESELGLYRDGEQIAYITWQAHRQLSDTIHHKLQELLGGQNIKLDDLEGIAIYKGPGSFTGLRIGFSVANALAVSYEIPIFTGAGDDWQDDSIAGLENGENEAPATPDYGGDAFTKPPKK